MVRLTLKIVAAYTDIPSTKNEERVLYECEFDRYESVDLDCLIVEALSHAQVTAGVSSLSLLKPLALEVVISLFVDEEQIRPALHFNVDTIRQMAEAGASFDFDPYVYQ
jgi:hypothetical protein